MRDETIIALLLVLVLASAGAGFYVGNSSRQTTTATSTYTEAVPTVTTLTVSMTSESCIVSAESTGFFLHLVTDSGSAPVAGIPIKVIPVAECTGNPTLDVSDEANYATNGSGWAVIADPPVSSNYYLVYSFQYGGRGYNVSASWRPQQGTFTTVTLPSGNVSTVFMIPKSCNVTCTY